MTEKGEASKTKMEACREWLARFVMEMVVVLLN
jgi:hypothetical protein